MTTIEAILEAERKAEETQTYKGHTIATLRQTLNVVVAPKNWKSAWAASVPHHVVEVVMVAVEFFHADRATLHGVEPITGLVLMSGNGYQA